MLWNMLCIFVGATLIVLGVNLLCRELGGVWQKWRAARWLKKHTPSNAELLKLADKYPAPQEWYDEEGPSAVSPYHYNPGEDW